MSILKLKDRLPNQVHLLHLLIDFTMPLAVMNTEIIKIRQFTLSPNTYSYVHILHSVQFVTQTLYALDPTAPLGDCWLSEPSRDVSYTCWTINEDGDNEDGDNEDGDNEDGDNEDGDNEDGDNEDGDNEDGDRR